ncbi:DUF6395 domain-containing protein [Glutamicibacter arilaitensis]|uniref:DUF6395 domain-containing protein n=1 Tax=Glutamicibacter arilaitensis TaxID=256701 RepID=UPI003A8CF1BF
MKIDFHYSKNRLSLTAELEVDDRKVAGKATLRRPTATFALPDDFDYDNTHPDLLALAALVTFYPWVGKELSLPFAVSQHFADSVQKASRIQILRVAPWMEKRSVNEGSKPGLSFSGGVDSMAALALMPDDTECVFTLRTPPPEGGHTLYKPDMALYSISEMRKAGKSVHVVETDHEWVREPVGFSVDPAPAVPLMLLADHLNLDAISFGTIAESSYSTGKGYWEEYTQRTIYTRWKQLFEAAGLMMYMPTVGISEIGSSTIVQTSKFGYLAQSCIRGLPGEPCRACVKCFRKSLIAASLNNDWPEHKEVSRMMANRTIRPFLEKDPIRFEIILTRVMASYEGDDPLLNSLQERLASLEQDVSFTAGWYPAAMRLIPRKYQASTIIAANRYLPMMTDEQIHAFEHFDLKKALDKYEVSQVSWLKIIANNADNYNNK